MKNSCHFQDTCISGDGNPEVSCLDLTLEAGISGVVMWSLIDGKHNVFVPHHDGLIVDMVDDGAWMRRLMEWLLTL